MIEVVAPSPGESVTEVIIDTWYKADGEYVERDEKLADIESDKAMLELYAEESGKLQIMAAEGDTVEVNNVIAKIDTSAEAPAGGGSKDESSEQPSKDSSDDSASAPDAPPSEEHAQSLASGTSYASGQPSPSAARVMDEKNLTSADVPGTGRGGRITKADAVNADAKTAEAKSAPTAKPDSASAAQTGFSTPQERNSRREKLSRLRQTLAKRLVSVKNDTAMLTTFNEVDMSAIMSLRKQYKEQFKDRHEVGLGFMSFFTRACCEALKDFPQVNAYIDGDELVFHDYVDMGVAVSTERGLVVPVLRNAESMSFSQIEQAINDLAGKARNNRITINEMTGGTFTITNGGVFGSLLSTPILNPPQSAILGMHKIEERPVAINGEVVVKPMMYLALSYDHRVIDGKESVSYLVRVKECLEDPVRMLLDI